MSMIDEIHALLSDAFGSDDPNVGPMLKYLARLKEPTDEMHISVLGNGLVKFEEEEYTGEFSATVDFPRAFTIMLKAAEKDL